MTTQQSRRQPPESVAVVLKVFALMQALGNARAADVATLSVLLAMPQATVLRLLHTVEGLGYVREAQGRWSLTLQTFELGAKALQFTELVEVARPAMKDLAAATGEAVQLGVSDQGEVMCLHKIDARDPLGLNPRIGQRAPLNCTAIGKALLAWEPRQRRQGQGQDDPLFEAELERVRGQGFGEESNVLAYGVGVPIFDHMGLPVAGLGLYTPRSRLSELPTQAKLLHHLHQAGRDISMRLGCPMSKMSRLGA